jgi:hypothetical protein
MLVSALTATAAALAWVPFVTKPPSPDEGGFLLVASQWAPGGSLYGHYWVDRPPLLIGIFQLALVAGGPVALRLIGIAAVVASILLAGHLCRHATRDVAPPPSTLARATPVVLTGTFLSTPLFGTTMVNGELLAVPLVLLGIVALMHAHGRGSPRSLALCAVAAGAAAAAAPLVKQNVLDVLVVAAVLVAQRLRHRQGRQALLLAVGVVAGAGLTTGNCLLWAEARGTEPGLLWDALVTFRASAAEVIDRSSTGSASGRLVLLVTAAAASAAPFLLVALALRMRRPMPPHGPTPDLRLPAAVLLLWEVVAIGAGGSYWLHYLIGLVPGMALLAVAAAQRPESWRRVTAVALAVAVFSAAVNTVTTATSLPSDPTDSAVAAYLRAHSNPTNTVVVGFGRPDIVWDSGLRSPYDELWSLPVRVRDPRLTDFRHVLAGPDAPTWVVVRGTSLATWGVDATAAERVLERRYRRQTTIGDYVIYRMRRAQLVTR